MWYESFNWDVWPHLSVQIRMSNKHLGPLSSNGRDPYVLSMVLCCQYQYQNQEHSHKFAKEESNS
jgi:hypothetical protein